MAHSRTGAVGMACALVAGVAIALVLGAALRRSGPASLPAVAATPTAAPPFASTIVVTPTIPTVAALPASPTPAPPTVPGTVSLPMAHPPTPPAVALPATATPEPQAWTEVARWQDKQFMVTEPFTVPGPWRICWALPDTRHTFQLMVGDATQTTWELLSGPPGVPSGAFDLAQGGTYRLMFHNETPYTVVVLARPAGGAPGDTAPPPCG